MYFKSCWKTRKSFFLWLVASACPVPRSSRLTAHNRPQATIHPRPCLPCTLPHFVASMGKNGAVSRGKAGKFALSFDKAMKRDRIHPKETPTPHTPHQPTPKKYYACKHNKSRQTCGNRSGNSLQKLYKQRQDKHYKGWKKPPYGGHFRDSPCFWSLIQ